MLPVDIRIGATIRLLKPILLEDGRIETHKSFSPLKSQNPIEITPSSHDLANFEEMIGDSKNDDAKIDDTTPKNLTTFKTIQGLKNQANISKIPVLVASLSREIETKIGKYRIAQLVDIEGDSMDINLYDSKADKIEYGQTYHLTNLKLVMLNKDGKFEKRLVTTSGEGAFGYEKKIIFQAQCHARARGLRRAANQRLQKQQQHEPRAALHVCLFNTV